MLQNLLAERLKLTIHRENRTLPEYELVTAKGGPKLEPAKAGAKPGISYEGKFWSQIHSQNTTAANFASFLSDRLDRSVIDKTGIQTPIGVNLEYRISDTDTDGLSLMRFRKDSVSA